MIYCPLIQIYIHLYIIYIYSNLVRFTEDTGEFQQSIFSTGFQMNVEGSILHNISQPAGIGNQSLTCSWNIHRTISLHNKYIKLYRACAGRE